MSWSPESDYKLISNSNARQQGNIELKRINPIDAEQKLLNEAANFKQNSDSQPAQWSKLLLLVGVSATIGAAIPIGFANGVMNNPANVIKAWVAEVLKERYGLVLSNSGLDFMWSSIVSIYLIGGTISSLCGGWAANKFGRKGCYLITGIFNSLGASFILLCRVGKSVEMLLIGRLFIGFASGLTTCVVPMYLVEIAPLALRGTLGVMVSVGVNIGVVFGQVVSLGQVLGTPELWQYSLSFFLILVLLCYIPAVFFPESPKYLYTIRNDRDAAFDAIARLRNTQNVALINSEIDEMAQEADQSSRTRSMLSVLRDPAIILPIILICTYQAGQQFSGINAIFYYSVSIFEQAGFENSVAQWANLGCGVLNLFVALQGPWLMAKVNRRPIMLTSLGGCSVFLILITIFLSTINGQSWLPVICVLGYIFFYQIGLGPLAYFVGSELTEVETRPAVMGLGSLASWAGNFIVAISFPLLQEAWDAYVFLPFAIICVLMFLLTLKYLPESRGRDSSEIAPLVANGFKSKVK